MVLAVYSSSFDIELDAGPRKIRLASDPPKAGIVKLMRLCCVDLSLNTDVVSDESSRPCPVTART